MHHTCALSSCWKRLEGIMSWTLCRFWTRIRRLAVQGMRAGHHLHVDPVVTAMYALVSAIEQDHGFEVADKWLQERLLSVMDVQDVGIYQNWQHRLRVAQRVLPGLKGAMRISRVQRHAITLKSSAFRRPLYKVVGSISGGVRFLLPHARTFCCDLCETSHTLVRVMNIASSLRVIALACERATNQRNAPAVTATCCCRTRS